MNRLLDVPKEGENIRLSLENGKYTIISRKDGGLILLRYGEPWKDMNGHKWLYLLIYELNQSRELIDKMKDLICDIEE